MGDDAAAIVSAFIERINAHDPEGVIGCCTTDHRFTDSAGTVLSGGEALDRAWRGYFNLFPDYHITIECAVRDGDLVLLTGWASASFRGTAWQVPAAWRALVRDGWIAEWQVFADNTTVRDLMQLGGAG